jgi:hypothetical protein
VESEGGSELMTRLGIWNFESTFVAANEPVICGWIGSSSGLLSKQKVGRITSFTIHSVNTE